MKIGSEMPTWLKIIVASLVLIFSAYMTYVYAGEGNTFFMYVAAGFGILNLAYLGYLVCKVIEE